MILLEIEPIIQETQPSDFQTERPNVFFLCDPIEANTFDMFQEFVYTKMQEYKDYQKDKKPDLMLYIDSPGGEISAALQIIDLIRYSGLNFKQFIQREQSSAQALISLACQEVYQAPSAIFLLHDIRLTYPPIEQKLSEIKDQQKLIDSFTNTIEVLIKDNTELPAKTIEKIFEGKEMYYTVEEMLKYKIIDQKAIYQGYDTELKII